MTPFNPFSKPIQDLQSADLSVLATVSEGWYVEYKGEIGDTKRIAKSISSFANTYGGWVFYGVEEALDGHRRAGNFPGIPASDVGSSEVKIREAIRTYTNPSPFFEIKILNGPVSSIGLAEGRAIIAVYTPLAKMAPIVHGSGRIYRRVADSSDPKAETDRHFLDLLWSRSRDMQQSFRESIENAPELSKAEDDVSLIKLMFLPDPWQQRNLLSQVDFANFSKILREADGFFSLPFDNFFTCSDGFVARQVKNNNPYSQLLTWKYRFDCSSEVIVPLSSTNFSNLGQVADFLNGYATRDEFLQLCRDFNFHSGRLIDLSHLAVVLFCVLRVVDRLVEAEGLPWTIQFKAQISGVWRRTPFIDLVSAIKFIAENGVVMIQKGSFYAPDGFSPDDCRELPQPQDGDAASDPPQDNRLRCFLPTIAAFSSICNGLGLPVRTLMEQDENFFGSLFGETFQRANKVGATRRRPGFE